MTDADFSAAFSKSAEGDIDSYMKLYGLVYRSLYRIARFSLKSEALALSVLRETASDSFSAAHTVKLKNNAAYAQWMIKILCTKIKLADKMSDDADATDNKLRSALDCLKGEERLLLAVMTVCKCSATVAAKLCSIETQRAEILRENAFATLEKKLK